MNDMGNMSRKKRIILISIIIVLVLSLVVAGTYALWTWNSNVNKNVVFNTSNEPVIIDLGEKLVQYIHIPIYLTQPDEINMSEFEKLKTEKELKSGRGSDGMGSGKETL